MAEDVIICTICGAKNEPTASRCSSCGAKLDAMGQRELTAEEREARKYQQDTFEWKWVGIAFGIYLTLQAIALVALPMVIDAYDPQGLPGLLISAGVWFVGGAIVGWLSPGKTFFEPAVGALIATIPTLWYVDSISDVHKTSLLALVTMGIIGVMLTLLAGFIGEKIQMSTRGHD